MPEAAFVAMLGASWHRRGSADHENRHGRSFPKTPTLMNSERPMQKSDSAEQTPPDVPSKKPVSMGLITIIVVVGIIALAASVLSRPTFGQKTTTDTSVKVVVGQSKPASEAQFRITLKEGGDPAHEVDHVIEPLKGVWGLSTATMDWSSGVVLTVTYDPAEVSEQDIAARLAEGGYAPAP